MAHPPGSENDPDDRDAYVQDNGYAEDADGNMIGEGEGGQVPEGWPSHEAATIQARTCTNPQRLHIRSCRAWWHPPDWCLVSVSCQSVMG